MAYVVLLVLAVAAAGCSAPQPAPGGFGLLVPAPAAGVAGEVCAPNDPLWVECMKKRRPGRHAPTKLIFDDWRT